MMMDTNWFLAMMHRYGYRYGSDTGTGIQHFFKNLGYDTLGISVLITYEIYSIYIFYI